ncbi:MAG TPA: GntR family transcriptional regulator [Conexibacter sp.]|nr:GntR family transcriptional regulator [Conexibacter sp.]
MPKVKPTRSLLYLEVKEILLARIARGTYRPGDRLVETRIARELDVSQGTVREALRELEAMRLVESQPHRGARVRAVSPEELAEAHQVRAALEEYAARRAAERHVDVTGLQAEVERMSAAAAAGDATAYARHSVSFHRRIVEASGNRLLREMWNALRVETRTTLDALRAGFDLDAAARSHQPIVDALAAADADAAAELSRRHAESFQPAHDERGTHV